MALTSFDRAKQQYLEQQVASASPERLLTLLYDRLLVDIDRAASAQASEDWLGAGTHLTHAQWIVSELNGSLTDEWDGSAELRGVYVYLTGRLIAANITRDPAATAECRDLVAPLREAWHAAAELTAAGPTRSASAVG